MDIKNFYRDYKVFSTLIIMLALSVIIILTVTGLTAFITNHGEEYELPDFTGLNAEQLETFDEQENIYDYTFIINDSVFVPEKKGGTVLSQDPAAGSKVKKGRKIYLSIVAFSMPKVEMPNLVNLSLRQAENMLLSNDLKLGQPIFKASRYNNAVLEQRYNGKIIEAGTLIPYKSSITLIVGRTPNWGEEIEDEEINDYNLDNE